LISNLNQEIRKNNSQIDTLITESLQMLTNLERKNVCTGVTANSIRTFKNNFQNKENDFDMLVHDIAKTERIANSKGEQLDELNRQFRKADLNNFIQKNASGLPTDRPQQSIPNANNNNNLSSSRVMAPPKEYAPISAAGASDRRYIHSVSPIDANIDTASVAVAVGQKLTKQPSDSMNRKPVMHQYSKLSPQHQQQAQQDPGGIEGVWV